MELHWIGCAANNFCAGRATHTIRAIVLHLIDGTQAAADAVFVNDSLSSRRSAHYSISKTGRIHQYVLEEDTAYHAGRLVNPTWPHLVTTGNGIVNPNLYSIGIEHEGRPHDPWTDAMYEASASLLRAISIRHPRLETLSRENVALHREIRADKSCPGFQFSLDRLLEQARASRAPTPASPLPLDGAETELNVVKTTKRVNLRRGRPSLRAPIVRVIPPEQYVNVIARVPGDRFQDSNIWWRTVDHDYLWSGATDLFAKPA